MASRSRCWTSLSRCSSSSMRRWGTMARRRTSGQPGMPRAVAPEIVRTVRVMDARNRQRFSDQGKLLGSWISASTVLGTPRPGTELEGGTAAGGEARSEA
jgi:hypothetical protein